MRAAKWSMLVVLIAAFPAQAQNMQPPAPDLVAVMRAWEAAMTNAKDFIGVIDRETFDKALSVKDRYTGMLWYSKVGNTPSIRYVASRVDNRQLAEKYIVNGNQVFEFLPAT